jgi:23S rRNA (guanosine2251-2'-O)-methyltransferase
VREALRLAQKRGIDIHETARPDLDRLSGGAVHQGIALRIPAYEYLAPDELLAQAGERPLIVALDGITDPRNLGAILRSAGAFGAHGVLIPERRSVGMTASAWKSSAGAAARVPVAQATNLVRALQQLAKAGCMIVGLDGDSDRPITESTLLDGPLVLVVGSEGKGLGRLVREQCDEILAIPTASSTESLNAGVATSIALYQAGLSRG